MCDVDVEAVAAAVDAPSIYDIPKVLHREGLDAYVIRRLGLTFRDVDWTDWDLLLERVHEPEHEVEVALVGKYIDLPDAYLSVTEALRAGGFHHDAKVRIRWVPSDACETEAGAQKALGGVDAVLVPGGFGVRGIEGKVGALQLGPHPPGADPRHLPGPAVHGHRVRPQRRRHRGRSSTEFDPQTPAPVIATMEEQKAFVEGAGDLGGTMRLGRQTAKLVEGSLVAQAYGATTADERHRHRYEVNNAYREELEEAGLVISGTSPGRSASSSSSSCRPTCTPTTSSTQAHPEFKSRPNRAHPLFAGLVGAAIEAPARVPAGRGRAPRPPPTPPPRRMPEPLRDRLDPARCSTPRSSFHGRVWDVVTEEVDLGEAGVVTATSSTTPAPWPSLALDEHDRVVLVQQYRHPVAPFEWELPAGLLDVDGEPAHLTAARELHEEADLDRGGVAPAARPLRQPGWLERGAAGVPRARAERRARARPPRAGRGGARDAGASGDARRGAGGRAHRSGAQRHAVVGVLAAHAARARGWAALRPHDAPWPEHPAYRVQA